MNPQPALRIAPPAFLSDPALLAVLAALPGARLVGGCVRDAIAGRPVADIDLATPHPEFMSWRWVDPHELPKLIVPFKRQLYEDVIAAFSGHLARV